MSQTDQPRVEPFDAVDVIAAKRDRRRLTEAQIEFLDKDEIAEKVDAVFAAARLEGR